MIIETKYDVGSEVWFMHQNKITSRYIYSVEPIACNTYDRGISIKARYRLEESGQYLSDNDLFPSKEALLQSL